MAVIGVISDTHGLLRPEAVAVLAGVDHIIHAGDIGAPEIITALERIAPVTAVRGNNDREAWARSIPYTDVVAIAGRRIYVLHNIAELELDPAAEGFAAVIAGHSHKPAIIERNGVLFLNPGSAGRRRFKLPIAVAKLHVDATSVRAEIHELAATESRDAQ
ncbi:MAG: metallophosphoesterase family protein [Steroidobacteraceae bacterium]